MPGGIDESIAFCDEAQLENETAALCGRGGRNFQD